jgi:CheY-like chemotaxis protein
LGSIVLANARWIGQPKRESITCIKAFAPHGEPRYPRLNASMALIEPVLASKLRTIVMTDTERKRVLVVEDDPNVAMIIKLTLARAGFSVQTAADGCEALDTVAETDFDLVLTDCCMPNMDGITMIEKLREDGKHSELPIIVVSGMPGSIDSPTVCDRLNVRAILPKPFSSLDLTRTVQDCLATYV